MKFGRQTAIERDGHLPPEPWRARLLPDALDIRQIARRLAKINRFAGNTTQFYSVAQHSVGVAIIVNYILPNHSAAPLYALLHDAHEALIGDVPTPLAEWIRHLAQGDVIAIIKDILDAHVHEALSIAWPPPRAVRAAIRSADLMMAATEIRDVVEDDAVIVAPFAQPRNEPIGTCWPWPRAEEQFLKMHEDYEMLAGPGAVRQAEGDGV